LARFSFLRISRFPLAKKGLKLELGLWLGLDLGLGLEPGLEIDS